MQAGRPRPAGLHSRRLLGVLGPALRPLQLVPTQSLSAHRPNARCAPGHLGSLCPLQDMRAGPAGTPAASVPCPPPSGPPGSRVQGRASRAHRPPAVLPEAAFSAASRSQRTLSLSCPQPSICSAFQGTCVAFYSGEEKKPLLLTEFVNHRGPSPWPVSSTAHTCAHLRRPGLVPLPG